MSEPSQQHVYERWPDTDPPIKGCAKCGMVLEAGVHVQFPADVKYPRLPPKPQEPDPEVFALATVVAVMEPLDIPQRDRVMAYLTGRFG